MRSRRRKDVAVQTEQDWIPPRQRHSLRLATVLASLTALSLLGLAAFGQALPRVPGFLTWHMLLEVLAIVVAALIFAVGWNTHALHRQRNILLASCAFLGVAILDFSHMLSFPGMPDFVTPSDPEKGIHFWLAARYLAAFALLALAWRPWQSLRTPTPRRTSGGSGRCSASSPRCCRYTGSPCGIRTGSRPPSSPARD